MNSAHSLRFSLTRLGLVLPLLLCLGACSLTHRVTPAEAQRQPARVYSEVAIPAKLSGVVLEVLRESSDSAAADSSVSVLSDRGKPDTLSNLEKILIHFDSTGGTLNRADNMLIGRSPAGDSIRIPFDSVLFLQFGGVDRGQIQMPLRAALEAQDYVRAHPDQKIGRDKYANWDIVRFDSEGGIVDSVSHRIVGRSEEGKPITRAVNDAVYFTWSESIFKQVGRHPYRAVRVGVALVIIGFLTIGPGRHTF